MNYQNEIEKIVEGFIKMFNERFDHELKVPPVEISTRKSRNAGECRWDNKIGGWKLVFIKFYLDENTEYMLTQTVPHEVAHYIAETVSHAQVGHGKMWKQLMLFFGREPKRCHNMALPQEIKVNTYTYICNCGEHQLSKNRHTRSQKGTSKYSCTKCNGTLKFKG